MKSCKKLLMPASNPIDVFPEWLSDVRFDQDWIGNKVEDMVDSYVHERTKWIIVNAILDSLRNTRP